MDTSDFEDMLFGEACTQTISSDALIEGSEDEILFPASGEAPLLWHEPYAASLTSPDAGTILGRHIHNNTTLHTHEQNGKPMRDRSCNHHLE